MGERLVLTYNLMRYLQVTLQWELENNDDAHTIKKMVEGIGDKNEAKIISSEVIIPFHHDRSAYAGLGD